MRRVTLSACIAALALGLTAGVIQAASVLLESLNGRQVFPVTNWWNLDISAAPIAPQSAAMINWISGRTGGNTTATSHHAP